MAGADDRLDTRAVGDVVDRHDGGGVSISSSAHGGR